MWKTLHESGYKIKGWLVTETFKVRDFGIMSQDRQRFIKDYNGFCSLAVISPQSPPPAVVQATCPHSTALQAVQLRFISSTAISLHSSFCHIQSLWFTPSASKGSGKNPKPELPFCLQLSALEVCIKAHMQGEMNVMCIFNILKSAN